MSWYAAHIIMTVKLKSGAQRRFPVWENIVLFSAKSEREAIAKAEEHGRLEEGDEDESFTWGDRPATWVFAGVRKVTECVAFGDSPGDGMEVSYNELELDSREAVRRLAAGEPTAVRYNDRFRPAGPTKQSLGASAVRKKKHA
ncbi:MAG: DUF4288 domain-containing protein [Planctomycetales bacterium]